MSNEANAARFNGELDDFAERELAAAVHDFQVGLGFEALGRIVERTPVDLGALKSSWQVDQGIPVGGDGAIVRSEQAVKDEGLARLRRIPAYESSFIATNVPYAPVIEEGKYPNPPKHGSRIRDRDLPGRRLKRIRKSLALSGIQYIVKSAGGFSIQAPNGVVAPVAAELENYLHPEK